MTSEKVAEWLRGCPDTSEVSPVTVTIGKQSYPGARYRQRGEEAHCILSETCPQAIGILLTYAIGSPMIRGNGTSGAIGKGRLAPSIKSTITRSDIALFCSPGFTVNLSTTVRENRIGECRQPSETDTMKIIGSQRRETLQEAGYKFVNRVACHSVILENEFGRQELWVENDSMPDTL